MDTTIPRVYYQSRKVSDHPNPGDRLPGSPDQLSVNGAQPPRGETETNQNGSCKASLSAAGVSKSPLTIHRETKCCSSSSGSCPPLLLSLAGQLEKCPRLGQPELQEHDNPLLESSRGANLVAATPPSMEWQVPAQGSRTDNHLLRCISTGMGSITQRDMDWRPVVRAGEIMAHQLPGNASSPSGCSDISEGPVRSLGAVAVGQHHYSSLHQQSGRNNVPTADWYISMDVGTSEGHNADSPTHTRHIQLCSGCGVQNNQGSQLNPLVFNRINEIFGPLEIDLFASQLIHQLPRYFSWRPDPLAEVTDAFQQNWGTLKGFANPPWCFMGRVLSQVMEQRAQVVLVAPVWKGQPWYPVLLGMLWEFP